MAAFRRNERVLMRGQQDTWMPARILVDVEDGAPDAWVCTELEWQTARGELRAPDAVRRSVSDLRSYPPQAR